MPPLPRYQPPARSRTPRGDAPVVPGNVSAGVEYVPAAGDVFPSPPYSGDTNRTFRAPSKYVYGQPKFVPFVTRCISSAM